MDIVDRRAQEVLDFWFRGDARDPRWFRKDDAFDREIRERFLPLYEAAAAGSLAAWLLRATECLALVIVLDQFPRNMFRGTARAFATDEQARDAARLLLAHGWDLSMPPERRLFAYLPFEHSEALADQDLACERMAGFDEEQRRYAEAHRDIVRRFGRFPHRNAALGRPSTAEEIEFLRQPGSGF
ncbi:MAG TPA: DUF924 family protein [Burkholderiales bacterium]|nr:DUF924 family protein [Burkholderiales bacterium]